jgi:hypothetical protein
VNHVVAIAVPAIPVIPLRSGAYFVAHILARTTHRRHVTLLEFGDSLRRRDLGFSFSHDDDRVAIGPHFDAEYAILMRGM